MSLEALLSAEGVPLALNKGDNHVVVVAPTRGCDHRASGAVPRVTHPAAAFDTAEHVITVAGTWLTTGEGKQVTKSKKN